MSPDTALRLESSFGSDAQGWLNLQSDYEYLRLAENATGRIIKREIHLMTVLA